MSVITNKPDSLSSFLAQSATGGVKSRPSDTSANEFAASLEQALEGLGVSGVKVRPAATEGESPSGSGVAASQFVITLAGGQVPAGDAAEVSTIEPGGYDPAVGPRITREMWTDDLLEGDLPNEVFLNVQDKADFLKARLERVQQPTPAVVQSDHDGSESPLNGSFLSTREQAESVKELLLGLGIDPGEIVEIGMGGPFSVDWRGDGRRQFNVGDHNVGLILERYAKYPKEQADRMMIEEFAV